MNIALIGYGQMGKQIETVAQERGHQIVTRVDPVGGDAATLSKAAADEADGAIEFSVPSAVSANVKMYNDFNLNAVVGTTGWYDELQRVREVVESGNIGLLYGPNFSIGAHLFFKLVSQASRLSSPIKEYDILGYELHHKKKKDSPSGTALSIARLIMENNDRKTSLVTEKLDRAIEPNELHFASVRGGSLPGVHKVLLDSEADTIELTHTARSRKGFALGAVMALEWLEGKRGLFNVEDFIGEIFKD
jgi:4-hydroxy-tetrahydrodipicolinate reductase